MDVRVITNKSEHRLNTESKRVRIKMSYNCIVEKIYVDGKNWPFKELPLRVRADDIIDLCAATLEVKCLQ